MSFAATLYFIHYANIQNIKMSTQGIYTYSDS